MESEPKKRPQQSRGQKTRRKLLAAALELFKTQGYSETTARHISESAGVAIGSFYVYFQDKKAVFSELMDSYYHDFQNLDLVSTLAPPVLPRTRKDQLHDLVNLVSHFIASMGDFYSAINALYQGDEAIRQEINAFESQVVHRIQELLMNLPQIRRSPEPEAQALLLYLFMENMANRLRYQLPVSDDTDVREEMVRWLELLLFSNGTAEASS